MKLGTPTYTSPRAMGSKKAALGSWGAVDAPKKVGLVTVKGEVKAYGSRNDDSLPQHGGEGTKIGIKSDDKLLKPDAAYQGPGSGV